MKRIRPALALLLVLFAGTSLFAGSRIEHGIPGNGNERQEVVTAPESPEAAMAREAAPQSVELENGIIPEETTGNEAVVTYNEPVSTASKASSTAKERRIKRKRFKKRMKGFGWSFPFFGKGKSGTQNIRLRTASGTSLIVLGLIVLLIGVVIGVVFHSLGYLISVIGLVIIIIGLIQYLM